MRWEPEHLFSRWGPWKDAGNGQEARSRKCILHDKCPATQTKWRKKKIKKVRRK